MYILGMLPLKITFSSNVWKDIRKCSQGHFVQKERYKIVYSIRTPFLNNRDCVFMYALRRTGRNIIKILIMFIPGNRITNG